MKGVIETLGTINVQCAITQEGSNLTGAMLDSILAWINTYITTKVPTGYQVTITNISGTLTRLTVNFTISNPNVTPNGTLYDQALSWLKSNAYANLPSLYGMNHNINLTP
jgi:hypothetical protein